MRPPPVKFPESGRTPDTPTGGSLRQLLFFFISFVAVLGAAYLIVGMIL